MKGFLTTHKGMENIASLEVKDLINTNSKINEACVVFDIKNYEDLFKLCYKSQSSIGVYYLLCEFDFDNIFDDFYKNLEKINFKEWLNKNIQFRVKCIKINNGKLSTPEIEKKFGEIIIEHIEKKYNYRQKVDLGNPEIVIFAYLTGKKCYIGTDFAGFDLSKRSYKIFSHPADIKGTIAYSLARLSDYNKNETLLDPFSASGTIPIEAALFASKFPINYFNKEKFIFLKFQKFKNFDFNGLFKKLDKEMLASKPKIYNIDSSMKYLNYSRKNSKIAGIGKKISFSRNDIGWLDTKFKKGSIDKIVTILPSLQKKDSSNIYNEFFYQAEFILNKKGKIVLIGDKDMVEKFSSKYKFRIYDEVNVFSGKKEYQILVLGR
jgi:23S rRNA G2445 N2-methylase RlmL|tara:strand:+ start:2033 stop:3166 length:1134 start_codon:yes stop_codon:yes gene_type:complete